METTGIKYFRHIYHACKGSSNGIANFEKVNNAVHRSLLPDKVKIKRNGNISELCFCIENPAKWKFGSRISSLLETHFKNIFEGNLLSLEREKPEPETLLFCELASNEKVLIIDVFPGFYTHNPFAFRLLLEKHKFLLRKKPGSK